MTLLVHVLARVIVMHLFVTCNSELIDGSLYAQVLNDIMNNAVGVDQIQEYYNSLPYSNVLVDGDTLAREISSSLSSKFNGPIQALAKLKAVVEQEISAFPTSNRDDLVECCKATGTEYNDRFRHTVNTNEACITISENSPNTIRYPTERIMDVMKENYRENPELKWQYLGTEDGVLLNYPSFKFSTCRDYDPRFRPFYVSSATPVEKDVVILIDRSGSMTKLHNGRSLLQIAQQAAVSVLQTLNPNDRVAVISFSTNSEVLGSSSRECVRSYLFAEATPININFFKDEINRLTIGGTTNYEAALNAAFKFFETSDSNLFGEKRRRVILFLTDGAKTAGRDPLDLISRRNGALGNEVIILTYGLGYSFPQSAIDMLSFMANQSKTDSANGEIQEGIFEHVKDASNLRSAMASYYNLFSKDSKQSGASFTVPYIDLFGLGLLTSMCIPVYMPDNSLFGVVCSDLTMANLLSDITYFRQGEKSYSFIIDSRGRTLMHPLLPLPSQASEDPIYVDVKHLERESDATEVIASMKSGNTGSKRFTSARTLSRGDVVFEGINTNYTESTYHWRPVDHSNFSLCIVVGFRDTQATVDANALQPSTETFSYHRRDLLGSGNTNCVHFNTFATKDKSAVMLNPGAFTNPSRYLETEETMQQINEYTEFLTGQNTKNPGLKPSIISSVTASYKAEQVWKANEEAGRTLIWRYLGTTDGVMRLYPAAQLAKNYDHTRRPWYERTFAHKGKLVISTPYGDLWGSGYLVSLTRAITEPGSAGSTIAVAGTDMTLTYMYETFVSLPAYSICENGEYQCFIVDDSGFVVLHKDFIEPDTATPNIDYVHLTFKVPTIADDLLTNKNMVKTDCIDFGNIKKQFTYRLTIPPGGLDRLSSTYVQYAIRPVTGTNVFIVIQRNRYVAPRSFCCQNYGAAPDVLFCGTSGTQDCGCLCYTTADFNYCKNEYNLLADSGPTCMPQTPKLDMESISQADKVKDLPHCYDNNCGAEVSQRDCHGTSGCSWCTKDSHMNLLASPYCTRQESCYFGIQDLQICLTDPCGNIPDEDGEDEGDSGSIGGLVAGLVGGFIGACVGLGFLCRYMRNRQQTSARSAQRTGTTNTNPNTFANVNPAFTQPTGSVYYTPAQHAPQQPINQAFYGQQSVGSNVGGQPYTVQPSAPQVHTAPPTYDESQTHQQFIQH